jgi:hypothetical protein
VRVDPQGIDGPTRRQARGSGWRRTSQGLYVPSAIASSPEQRIVEAAAPLPPAGGVTGWAAVRWCGAAWFDGLSADGKRELPVVLASCQDDIRPQAGMTLSQERLNPAEVTTVDGLRVTVPERSVCFEMRYAEDEREATVRLDMAAYSDLVSISEVTAYVIAHPGWTGAPQARRALSLAEENSWSPWEVRMRLVWVLDAALPPPLCNRPIFDRWGRHIGTPDLFDPEAGVGGEYDGALHLSGAQRSRDLRREGLFRRHGLEYFTVLAGDMADRQLVAERMVETRERAIASARSPRAWTLTPPSWWVESHAVEQRRALTGTVRGVVLRRRRRVA